ncbi:MAG: hypothetical protein IPK32_05030 [Verrucomicrobiaceae bacterium]|nr:hypothetical protein [Verrucomicrobiaceae bacterium]
MQSSSTLAVGSWSFLPMVEAGGDAVLTFSLTSNEERQFVRLMYTDQFYVGSVGKADFDGDGLSNELEVSVEVRSNPLLADSDNDGVSDGDEVANSNDPNNGNPAPAFGGEAEKNPPQPVVYLATHGMMVENYWFKTDPDSPPVGIYADLSWDDDTIAPGSSTYEEFTPKWSEKWQSLVYPPQAGQDKDFRFNPYTFAGYSKHVFGTNPNLSISGKVSRARERVGLGIAYGSKVPWENAIRVLDYKYKKTRNPAAPSNPDVEISEVSFRVLKMDPNKVCTAVGDRVTLEQDMEDNIERYHVLARPDLYMQTGQSFAFDTVSYGTNGPQLWIMLPKDEQRNIGFVSRSQPGVNVFQVVGNVTPDVQLPQPAGPSVIPFVGSQVGDTAYLKMGVSKNYATPGVFPEGALRTPTISSVPPAFVCCHRSC